MKYTLQNGKILPETHGRLLDESVIISALEEKKKELEKSYDWGRIYGMDIAKDVVRNCPAISEDI